VGVATSLGQQAGHPVDRARLQDALLSALEPRRDDLDTAAGRLRQADEFRSRCTTIGRAVRIELADSGFEGTAVDVTAEGHLVVAVEGTTRTVVAGDVLHVRPPA
jgi:BirA family biotin operon repressor/biotin-[acetyl-CoA-carboxylase] ligase